MHDAEPFRNTQRELSAQVSSHGASLRVKLDVAWLEGCVSRRRRISVERTVCWASRPCRISGGPSYRNLIRQFTAGIFERSISDKRSRRKSKDSSYQVRAPKPSTRQSDVVVARQVIKALQGGYVSAS